MKTILAALFLFPALAFGQAVTSESRISLDARGEDVREVLATLFAQTQKPYALDAGIKGKLYVKLDSMPFPKALNIVLTQANLLAKEKDGVYVISLAPAPAPVVKAPAAVAPTSPVPMKKSAEPLPKIGPATYARKVTTRMTKAALSDVFESMGRQANVTIELDPAVPAYRIDAFFVKTSLKYALNRVCKAAGLHYEAVDGKIKVTI